MILIIAGVLQEDGSKNLVLIVNVFHAAFLLVHLLKHPEVAAVRRDLHLNQWVLQRSLTRSSTFMTMSSPDECNLNTTVSGAAAESLITHGDLK